MKLHVVGIDLGKAVFHLVGLDSTGKVVIRKRCSRRQLLAFTANLQVDLIGMESYSGSHFLGRALRDQGHEVRLMPAQYVKPYVQTNKSDYMDAEAIAEAVQRPGDAFRADQERRAVGFTSAASREGTLGDATYGGLEPDPQSSSGTWIHAAQRAMLCGGGSAADFGRCRVATVGLV